MRTVYRLVGFDNAYEQVVFSRVVPNRLVNFARKVAHFTDDPEHVGDAHLTREEAKDIARAMDVPIEVSMREWFLMPSIERAPAKKRERV